MNINTSVLTIEELLNDKNIYEIPIFQRGYSWKRNFIEDFWNDLINIENSTDRDYNHLLGAMVFTAQKDKERISILDGQQRFGTILLFLAALRDALQNSGLEKAPDWIRAIDENLVGTKLASLKRNTKLELNRDDKIFFRKVIDDNVIENPKLYSHKLIKDAYLFFKDSFLININSSGEAFVESILHSLTERVIIIKIEVDTDSNAHLIFETLNDRGMDLSVADLVKNYLFSISREDLENNIILWKEIIDQVGDHNVTRFLRHFWISNYEFIRKEVLYKKIKEKINKNNVTEFLVNLSKQATLYSNLSNPTHEFWADSDIEELLLNLGVLRAEQVYSVLMALYYAHKKNINTFKKLLRIFLNFTFRYSTICGLNPNELEPLYSDISIKIRKNQINKNQILEKIQKKSPSKDTFISSFMDFESKTNKPARYILLEINEFLLKQEGQEELKIDAKEVNLEHIIPRNPDHDWLEFFKSKSIKYQNLIYKIGNMTILLSEYNRKLKNKSFSKKQVTYKKSQLPLNKHLAKINEFGEDELIKRQKYIAGIAENIWKV